MSSPPAGQPEDQLNQFTGLALLAGLPRKPWCACVTIRSAPMPAALAAVSCGLLISAAIVPAAFAIVLTGIQNC